MSDIPSELFRNILTRTPTKSLLRFRTVSKSWRQLIDNPSFIKSHIENQPFSPTLSDLLIRTSTGKLFTLPLDSLTFIHGNQIIEATPIKNLIRCGVPRILSLPVSSCNGLILISHYNVNKTWVLWNPLTQEFYELPEYEDEYDLSLRGTGIGYDCGNDDIKVVRIDQIYFNRKLFYQTSVYSLKDKTCRWIKDCPCDPRSIPCGTSQGVYVNGVLYWLSWEFVIALDLSTEDYHKLPLPIKLVSNSDVYLYELGGFLVFCCDYWIKRMDGWMMKDDGGEISWTKLFSLDRDSVVGGYGRLRPVTYSKRNGRVLFQHEDDLIWFDIDNNSAEKIRIDGLNDTFSCQIWPGSLFRLKNYVGADEVISAQTTVTGVKRKRAVKRLKLGIRITESLDRSDSNYSSDEDLNHSGEEEDY